MQKKTVHSTTTTHEFRVVAAVDHCAIEVDRHQRARGDLGKCNAVRVDEEARRPRPGHACCDVLVDRLRVTKARGAAQLIYTG